MKNLSGFIAEFFGASLQTDTFESDIFVGQAVVQLVPGNPRRLALYCSNTGVTNVTFSLLNTVSTFSGKVLAPGADFDLFWYNELRELEKAWWIIGNASGGQIHLREVVFV